MSLYSRFVFPRVMDLSLRGPEMDPLRAETLAEARGDVLEIGFGSGLNAPHYPAAVEQVTAVEPNRGMWAMASKRIAAAKVPIELIEESAQALPFPERRFDTVVSTATLCSVDDLSGALREIRRVLKPEGSFLLLEHGLDEDPKIQKWQRRLNGLQRVIASGCNIDRPIQSSVERAGFRFERVRCFYFRKAPKTHGYLTLGTAKLADL